MKESTTREVFPDQLRGLALIGIAVVNAAFLGISVDGYTQQSIVGWENMAAMFTVITFAEGKFYLLFSFLFGYSASFILRDHSPTSRKRYLRRLLGLFLFGVVHAVFFFSGDILITYSILGVLLFLLSRSSNLVLKKWVIVSAAVAVTLTVSITTLGALFPEEDSGLGQLQTALEIGTFWDAACLRLETLPVFLTLLFLVQGPMAFVAFLLGLLASRQRLLAVPSRHHTFWKNCAMWGWGIGLPLQVAAAIMQVTATVNGNPTSSLALFGLALSLLSAPILSAGYLGSIALTLKMFPRGFAFLAPAGRMSLSVYLGESILLSFVFAGYGLGLMGQWGALEVTLASIAAWGALSVFAWFWMKKFKQGPFEIMLSIISGKRS